MRKSLGIVATVVAFWAAVVYLGERAGARPEGGPARASERAESAGDRRLQSVVASWPEAARLAAEPLVEKYGEPTEIGNERLTWRECGSWKRCVVYRDGGDAALEQVALHPVPAGKAAELAALPGVSVEGGGNELSVRGSREPLNFLAANLAHEVLDGQKTLEEAKAALLREKAFSRAGRSSPYLEGLRFDETGKTLEEGRPGSAP